MGYSVSVATIHRIQHGGKGAIRENIRKTGIFPKRPIDANADVVRRIRNMIKLVKSPTQREMTSILGLSLGTVN